MKKQVEITNKVNKMNLMPIITHLIYVKLGVFFLLVHNFCNNSVLLSLVHIYANFNNELLSVNFSCICFFSLIILFAFVVQLN